MSPSEASGRSRLNVKAADAGTEIFVSDGRFAVVATGCGELHADLPRGIYQIKLRSGFATHEEDLILDGTKPVVDKDYPALRFATPAPLTDTGKTSAPVGTDSPSEREAAAFINQQIDKNHVTAGSGSAVFVFARSKATSHPARGLTLWNAEGKRIAAFADQSAAAPNPPAGEAWAACNVRVKPGCYRLRLELDKGQQIEQTVVAVPNWHTRVFLGERAYGADPGDTQPDLPGAAIQYSNTPRFDPDNTESRLVELARLGLTNRRQMLSDTAIRQILDGKFKKPMLGLIGAHLLRATRPADTVLLRTVVDNLRRLFTGIAHPDVEALALTLDGTPGSYQFETPPMLRRSWELVMTASADRPAVLPSGGLAARVADRLWGEEPWLFWLTPVPESSVGFEAIPPLLQAIELGDYECALLAHLDRLSEKPATAETYSWRERIEKKLGLGPKPHLGAEEMRKLVLALGLPRPNVEKMLNRLFPAAP